MGTRAILTRQAFQGLLASAYGTLKVETTGLLSGETRERRTKRDFVTDFVQPCQKAKRTHTSVTIDLPEEERLKFILNCIGGFHSHCNTHVKLNEIDLGVLRNSYKQGIELLVLVNPTERLKNLYESPFFIRGCFSDNGDNYKMEFIAYYLDFGENGELGHKRRAELVVPRRVLRQYF